MEGCALQELWLLERATLLSVCSADHRWLQENGGTQGLGGTKVSSQHHYKAAVFCLSLYSGLFLFVFPHHLLPVTVSGLSSPPCWFLSAKVLILSLVHLRFLWLSAPHTPLPQFLQSQQMERSMVPTERRQETPWEICEELSTFCAHNCREVCVPHLLPQGDTLYVVRVLCFQQSTNRFSKVYNLVNLGADYPGHSKRYISASEAPSWQISSLFLMSCGNESTSERKSSPRCNTESSFKLSEVLGTVAISQTDTWHGKCQLAL